VNHSSTDTQLVSKMSAIKEFFKKKKTEAKFKLAEAKGAGHRLTDGPSSSGAGSGSGGRPLGGAQERKHPSQSAQQAGAAALNRFASQDKESVDFKKARQKALIAEQARKELAAEEAVDKEIAKIKETYGENVGPKEVEAPSGAGGIFYTCSLLGEGVKYPKDVMKAKIKEFLLSQLSEERALTSVLIIHTCNSPRERVNTAVETLTKYIDNIINNPTEMKYRRIRKNNKAFQERVASLEGTSDFLLGCGFSIVEEEGEEFWVFSGDLETLQLMKETLIGAEPVAADLDRNLTLLPPGATQKLSIGELPHDFFSISGEEAKREQERRQEVCEREGMLRTKAMREKEEMKGKRRYRFCLMRVRFPDGWMVQGTFGVEEPITAVQAFVESLLCLPLPFQLTDTATGLKLDPQEGDTCPTILELGLVPASLLSFSWEPDIEADIRAQGGKVAFLREDLTS